MLTQLNKHTLLRLYRKAVTALDLFITRIDRWTRRYPRATALLYVLYGLTVLTCVLIVNSPEQMRAANGRALYAVEAR